MRAKNPLTGKSGYEVLINVKVEIRPAHLLASINQQIDEIGQDLALLLNFSTASADDEDLVEARASLSERQLLRARGPSGSTSSGLVRD